MVNPRMAFGLWRRRVAAHLRAALGAAPKLAPRTAPRLAIHRLESLEAYRALIATAGAQSWDLEHRLAVENPDRPFKVDGYCWIDDLPVAFGVDYLYAQPYESRLIPNWRERLMCPACNLNNRQRACVHVASEYLGLKRDSRIYMTEQVTPTFALMSRRHSNLVGSEYLGDDIEPGTVNAEGVRHEDVTRLSFADESFDAVLSFDVFEHVPSHRKAFAECKRILKPSGTLLFSVPFLEDAPVTKDRAYFDASGALVHEVPPAYHGDPIRPGEGVLVFHDFGWDILEHAREAGFTDVTALAYRDPGFGYLGGWPLMFAARR